MSVPDIIDAVQDGIYMIIMLGSVALSGLAFLVFVGAIGNVIRLVVLALMGYTHDKLWTYRSGPRPPSQR